MNRLTYKLDEPVETKYLHYKYKKIADYDIDKGNFGRITDDLVYNKLGKLEDLEEELGISLPILFKALKNGIYVKNLITKETMHIDNADVILKYDDLYSPRLVSFHKDYYPNEELYFCVNAFNEKLCYMIKGYKKTWALCEGDFKSE